MILLASANSVETSNGNYLDLLFHYYEIEIRSSIEFDARYPFLVQLLTKLENLAHPGSNEEVSSDGSESYMCSLRIL